MIISYWSLIAVLQVYLIYIKLSSDDFIVWNIITLLASLYFIVSRLFSKLSVYINVELIILLLIIINIIMTIATQIVIEDTIVNIGLSALLLILSIFIGYKIKKEKTL